MIGSPADAQPSFFKDDHAAVVERLCNRRQVREQQAGLGARSSLAPQSRPDGGVVEVVVEDDAQHPVKQDEALHVGVGDDGLPLGEAVPSAACRWRPGPGRTSAPARRHRPPAWRTRPDMRAGAGGRGGAPRVG